MDQHQKAYLDLRMSEPADSGFVSKAIEVLLCEVKRVVELDNRVCLFSNGF